MTVHHPDKRVRRTKEQFKETLLALMEEKSFHDITITEIVKAADFNRGTFYAHYEKKEDLLDEMIEEMFKQMTEAYRKPYLEIPIIDFTQLQPESIVFFNHFLENKRFYKIMFSKKTNNNFSERLIKHLEPLFRKDFDYAATIDDNQLDIHLFGTYRIYGAIGLLLEWIENDFKQNPLYIADQLIRIYQSNTPKILVKK
ncbi:TetR/AcrR family transcriptional regulator [Neobacillus niacini]|uniref:TetR/AcrR family transcriptional regulator n=1 Tax=Neobacillus niacini TaxID=86668 RepID=UPI003000ADE0